MADPSGNLRLLFAAGGSGGHIYPALAVAGEVRSRVPDAEIIFAATTRGLESDIVGAAGYRVELIRVEPLRGGSLWRRLKSVLFLPLAMLDAWRLLRGVDPHVVMGVGGYLSGPLLAMASLTRRPTLLVEPNVEPGLANRWLSGFVDAAAIAWEETHGIFGDKAFLAGNPVRPEFAQVIDVLPDEAMRILLVGGSQGAHVLNEVLVGALPLLEPHARRLHITHQTGAADAETTQAAYTKQPIPARVEPYIEAMAEEYARCDLVLCRAGATTCAELTVAGRPAVMVPLPGAGGHQRHNAEALQRAGAAIVIDQADLTPERLARTIVALLEAPERRLEMARKARALARPDAAATISERLLELATESSRPIERRS